MKLVRADNFYLNIFSSMLEFINRIWRGASKRGNIEQEDPLPVNVSFQKRVGGDTMLIQVAYLDDRYDYLKEFQLDRLLELRQVVKFRRSSGWVQVGVDPIREGNKKTGPYFGPERRTEKNRSTSH
ncbi:MAG: GSU3473 family protein [Geobacteraceae bacterium]